MREPEVMTTVLLGDHFTLFPDLHSGQADLVVVQKLLGNCVVPEFFKLLILLKKILKQPFTKLEVFSIVQCSRNILGENSCDIKF